jgi:hypothetical protein
MGGASDDPVDDPVGGYVLAARQIPPELERTRHPVVGGIDSDLLREGDPVTIDGTLGSVELAEVEATEVVTAFLQRPDGRILLLRRSDRVGSFRGAWAAVSGFLEDPTPEAQARREILEETGILPQQCRLATAAPVVYARADRRMFVIHPFRFEVDDPAVRLDWEHTEFEWVDPSEIVRRSTVPKLDRAWIEVAPSVLEPLPRPGSHND